MGKFRLIFGATVFVTGLAMADDQPLDVTIRVLDSPATLPGAVTKTIQLPPSVAESVKAPERSERGLEIANEARSNARQAGQDVAEKAKDKATFRQSNPSAAPAAPPGRGRNRGYGKY